MRAWLRRSTPGQLLSRVAVILLLLSICLSQVTTFYDRRDERSRTGSEVADLRGELSCRSRIAGDVSTEELRFLLSLGDAFLALSGSDAEQLRVQAQVRRRRPVIVDAIEARENAEVVCR